MASPAEVILAKITLPTHLDSVAIRERIAADIRQRALFSARMTSKSYLEELKRVLGAYASGEINAADARSRLQKKLQALRLDGYSHALTDPGSTRRLNLILETQRKMAQSVARVQGMSRAELLLYPAWRLERYGFRKTPRSDWKRRWTETGNAVAWRGAVRHEMVALKNSPIWEALGNGAGGFSDTLGNPYPPFAYGSGLDWTDVSAEEAERLGLDVHAAQPTISLAPSDRERLQSALNKRARDSHGHFAKTEGEACTHEDGREKIHEPTSAERTRSQRLAADWIDSFTSKMTLDELKCSRYEGKAFLAGNPEIQTAHGKIWFPNSKLEKFGDGKGRASYKVKRQERLYALLDPTYTPDFSGSPTPYRFAEAKIAVYTALRPTSYTPNYHGGQQLFYRDFGDKAAVVICSQNGMVNTYFVGDKRKVLRSIQ